jgi:NAD/NADP transhydrogenase beta subunit
VTPTVTGIAIAAALVLTWMTLGFGAFILLVLAMAVGAIIGRIVAGDIEFSALLDVFRGKRSSS